MTRPGAMGAGDWGLMATLALLWGSSFFWFKVLGAALPPFTIIAVQLTLAGVLLNLVAHGRGLGWAPRRWWRPLLLLGLFSNTLPYTLLIYGETKISSGLASIFGATTPIVALLAAHIFTHDEKLTRAKAGAVVLAFAGVAVLVGPTALSGGGQDALLGQAACLAVAVIYGGSVVYARRFSALPALQVAAGEITAAAMLTLPLALAFDRPWTLPAQPWTIWAALGGLSLFSTALAYLIYYRLLARAGAVNVSVVTVLTPVVATALGIGFLGERLEWRSLAGLFLIAVAIVVLDGRAAAWMLGGRRTHPGASMTEPPPGARTAPSSQRNREPILEVLRRVLPPAGTVLEIAAGAGEHAVWFARALPGLQWRPTDREPAALISISAWREASDLPNLLAPLALDASDPDAWPVDAADAVISINMIHIAPWSATEGLIAGAARILPPGGVLFLYGPYREAGVPIAPSNAAFDADLRARNPDWGLRDLQVVETLAARHGLALAARVAMPANNLSVTFRKQ